MSKIVASQTYLVSTALGNIAVRNELVTDHDVEDIIHQKAESQARAIQMVNIGKDLQGNPELPGEALPAIFSYNEEELP